MRNLILSLFLALLSFNGHAQVKLSQNGAAALFKVDTLRGQITPSQGTKIINPDLNNPAEGIKLDIKLKQEYLIRNSILQEILHGGGDAGGGNLFQGRPLEDYALDVKTSPEMQMAVKLLSTIGNVGFDRMKSEIDYVVNRKSWYVVPVDLPTLTGQSIGISFAADQGALQDFEEIWIDQNYFNKMKFEGRVQLLVHEIFMGLKVFAFESYYRQCEINKPFNVDCLKFHEYQDRKTLSIQPNDYKDVRKAVNVVFKNYDYLSKVDYVGERSTAIANEIFSSGGFDSYFLKPSNQTKATKEFDNRDIINALRNQITRGGLPRYCNHKIVEDLGNHTYRMRAQLQSAIAFDERNEQMQFKVVARDLNSGKTIISNSYQIKMQDKIMNITQGSNKSSLTLKVEMGVPAYNMQFFGGAQSAKDKKATVAAIAVGVTSDEAVTTLSFASFNVRDGKISFYDGKDMMKCFEKIEYLCQGPECLE